MKPSHETKVRGVEKSPGQLAFEEDVRRQPRYPDGGLRLSWDELSEVVKSSWERKPTPRNFKRRSA